MKRILLFLIILVLAPYALLAQAPVGFNYQAAIYQEGKPVSNTKVDLKLELMDEGGTVYYTEEVPAAMTDAAGFVNVLIGSKAEEMSKVPFGKGLWVSASVNLGQGYVALGKVKLQAVPYALHASAGMTIQVPKEYADTAALFQILDHDGSVIFKVSRDAVISNVKSGAKTRGVRGGFLVNTRNSDGTVTERMSVAEGIEFNADGSGSVSGSGSGSRGIRGGFLVNTRNSDGTVTERMSVAEGIEFNVDDGTRGVRGGFLVNSRTEIKGRGATPNIEYAPRLAISDGAFDVFVEEFSAKTRANGIRGGFAVNLNSSQGTRGGFSSITQQPLMFLGERESFVTIGRYGSQCNQSQRSTFSVRNRCDLKYLVQVTPEGEIQAKDDTIREMNDTIVKESKWSLKVRREVVLSNSNRWWTNLDVVFKVNPALNYDKPLSAYRIELDDKLKANLDITEVKFDKDTTRLGVRIKPDRVNQIPIKEKGILTIIDESDPNLKAEVEVWFMKQHDALKTSTPVSQSLFGAIEGDDTKWGYVFKTTASKLTLLNDEKIYDVSYEPADANLQLHYEVNAAKQELIAYFNKSDVEKLNANVFDGPGSKQEYQLKVRDKIGGSEGFLHFKIKNPKF